MKTKRKNDKESIYTYLDDKGILENGSHEDIQAVRKEYWGEYKRKWRKEKRNREKEFTIYFNTDELRVLNIEAKRHKLSRTSFIKQAYLAYLNTSYIVPDSIEMRKLSQTISMVYIKVYDAYLEGKLVGKVGLEVLKKIQDIERDILPKIFHPPSLKEYISSLIKNDPKYIHEIRTILNTIPNDT